MDVNPARPVMATPLAACPARDRNVQGIHEHNPCSRSCHQVRAQAAVVGISGWQRVLANCHRVRVDAPQRVRAKLAKERHPVLSDENAVWDGVRGRDLLQFHFACCRIQPPDVVRLLVREPQSAFVVEYGRVGVDLGAIGWPIFPNLTGVRAELADVSGEYGSEPDVALPISYQPVWA
jgi:hypothetical protein